MRKVMEAPRTGVAKKKTTAEGLAKDLGKILIGQDHAIEKIVPAIQLYQAGIHFGPEPIAVFFLAGLTGSGKTFTAEALAQVLHGSEKYLLRVDCGEYGLEHEVAKLIGAPPGYLGHRETQPVITQAKLNSVTSDKSSISVVVFDEIEKGTATLHKLLLGIMDKGILRLGDGNTVNFDRSIIFLTTNIGQEKTLSLFRGYGLKEAATNIPLDTLKKLTDTSIKSTFSQEFINRITEVIVYSPLQKKQIEIILENQLNKLLTDIEERHIGPVHISYTDEVFDFLLQAGISVQYGARELKRTIKRNVVQKIAEYVLSSNHYAPGSYNMELALAADKSVIINTELLAKEPL